MSLTTQLSFELTTFAGHVESRSAPPIMPPGLELAWFSLQALAHGDRSENQDNLVVVDGAGVGVCLHDEQPVRMERHDWPAGRVRLAVLDGMGGHSFGREVAEAVATQVLHLPAANSREEFSNALDALHGNLHALWGDLSAAPGCTLTLLEVVSAEKAWLYHVGDSRLYELTPEASPECLTIDHVPATRALLQGGLDAVSWRRQVHERSDHRISQAFVLGNALGSSPELTSSLYHLVGEELPEPLSDRADCRVLQLKPGASYLLSTDGLWAVPDPSGLVQNAWPTAYAETTRPTETLRALLSALERYAAPGTSDNTTALLLRVASE